MNPKVAIIIANYNYAHYVIDAMRSITHQTYDGPLRIYIVDDGSSDDSWDKISSFVEGRDDVFPQRIQNAGASAARNVAIAAAWEWADIFGILDADD